MTAPKQILAARELLADMTPLARDCGRVCGARCCLPDEDGQGGMLLFPGEEALYMPVPDWAKIGDHEGQGPLLTCEGVCPRENRPLACRLFPLTPLADGQGGVTVALDIRAWPVCPLMEHGLQGLSSRFVEAVTEAAQLLWQEPACRAHIEHLTDQLQAYQSF